MKITPKTDDEILRESLLEPGEYDFEVIHAVEKVSKSGNDMIEVKLKVFTDTGGSRVINDYLLDALAWKVKHFCEAVGLLDAYNEGTLTAADCAGRSGRVEVKIQTDKTGAYPARNEVQDYVVAGTTSDTRNVLDRIVGPKSADEDTVPF